MCSLLLLCFLLAVTVSSSSDLPFRFLPGPQGWGVGFSDWAIATPLEAQTVFLNGTVSWSRGGYSSTSGTVANGTLTTAGGSVLSFQDTFSNTSASGFILQRTVEVVSVGSTGEYAFASQFSVPAPTPLALAPRQFFIPGVSYQNVSALPKGALAGDPHAPYILVREDRLPLPLVVAYFPGAGATLPTAAQLAHLQADGSTLPNEDFAARIVDARLQFGSLGFLNTPSLSLAFQYPGSEGDRTYIYSPTGSGWANRSHPLTPAFAHAYTLQLQLLSPPASASYAQAAQWAWRSVYRAYAPSPPPSPPPAQLYRDGMELLARVAVRYGSGAGVPSIPFEAALPGGAVSDSSSQMGFVGRALPAAALLLHDALAVAPNATRMAQATAVLDLWALNAPTPCGAVRTWYDIDTGSSAQPPITWRPADAYQGSLRIMADGMLGLLAAWQASSSSSNSSSVPGRDAWLAACLSFANFLLAAQAPDGSLASAWDWQCRPLTSDTHATAFAVPFLVAVAQASGDGRYRAAALAAGGFAARQAAAAGFVHTGGAVDNGAVADKEGGWLAAQAFLSLYELTGDGAAWLPPAAAAASYAETYVYAWSVPIACGQAPPSVYPCRRSTLGASLIATGQSGADNYMALAWYDYSRLGQWLGDEHFTQLAALLQAATTQVVDWDGGLGYAERGLLAEAVTLSVRRGAGVKAWLPWLTVNLLQPLVQQMQAERR